MPLNGAPHRGGSSLNVSAVRSHCYRKSSPLVPLAAKTAKNIPQNEISSCFSGFLLSNQMRPNAVQIFLGSSTKKCSDSDPGPDPPRCRTDRSCAYLLQSGGNPERSYDGL
eukprot:3371619-Rhodomonas_salina.1